MWNSTLVEDFWWSAGVRVEVRARLMLHPDAESLQSTEDDATVAVLSALSSLSPSDGGLGAAPAWLLLVAAAVGVAVVAAIAAVLYKLGFFKRHRHRDAALMISAKVTSGDEYVS